MGGRVVAVDELDELPGFARMFRPARNDQHVALYHRERCCFVSTRGRPSRHTIIEIRRVLAHVVMEPHALKHHGRASCEERELWRAEAAETGGEQLQVLEAIELGVALHPAHRLDVLWELVVDDVSPVIEELAVEVERERPGPPTRILRQETDLRERTPLVALGELLGVLLELFDGSGWALGVQARLAKQGFVPVQRIGRGRGVERVDVRIVLCHLGVGRLVTR